MSAILRADAKKQAQILEAQGKAEAILTVQKATADSIKLLNEAAPSDPVIRLRALEAFAAAADGKAPRSSSPARYRASPAWRRASWSPSRPPPPNKNKAPGGKYELFR